jgi:hypothetical protein
MKNQKKLPNYKSKLEQTFADILSSINAPIIYEEYYVDYIVPETEAKYNIDFTLLNMVHLEIKGYFRDYKERRKYELIRDQYPDLDLRFVFADPNKKIYKRSKTTYAMWADKLNYKWCSIKDIEQIKLWVKE